MKMTIKELEYKMLEIFPECDAASWDIMGLTVGDRLREITRVLVALDPTIENIEYAKKIGANLLITHHPPFINPPSDFECGASAAEHDGAVIYRAAHEGVALMNFHTALDFNPLGYSYVPCMLNFSFKYLLDIGGGSENKDVISCNSEVTNCEFKNGYGAVCQVDESINSVHDLAMLCKKTFESPICIWGDAKKKVQHVAWGQGSANSLVAEIVQNNENLDNGTACKIDASERTSQNHVRIDCFLAGELKYNSALDLSLADVPIILLGHDVSEEPFVDLLCEKVASCGVPSDKISTIRRKNWTII